MKDTFGKANIGRGICRSKNSAIRPGQHVHYCFLPRGHKGRHGCELGGPVDSGVGRGCPAWWDNAREDSGWRLRRLSNAGLSDPQDGFETPKTEWRLYNPQGNAVEVFKSKRDALYYARANGIRVKIL